MTADIDTLIAELRAGLDAEMDWRKSQTDLEQLARFIHAASPQNIRALLDHIDEVTSALEFTKASNEVLREVHDKAEAELVRLRAPVEGEVGEVVKRLLLNEPLPICPFDKASPKYWTTPNDKPCEFCGGLPEGPDKCRGADTRVMGEAADLIQRLAARVAEGERLVGMFRDRIEARGEWDDGCFYHNRTSASELQEPLLAARAYLAQEQTDAVE